MARNATWLNEDGLKVPFGTSDGLQAEAGGIHTKGSNKELRLVIDYSNLPASGTAVQGDNNLIPAGAVIISSEYQGSVTFSHAVEIGTAGTDGVVEDKNGLHTTAALAADTFYTGAGAQIGTVADEDLYVTVEATTTTPTAGAGELVITYRI